MDFEIIADEEAFAAMQTAWNGLLERSATRVPFLRHEYLFPWWETRGGGEWDAASRLRIIAAREEDGTLAGIAPLFLASHGGEPGDTLAFLGALEISDYLDFIVPPERLPAFVPALFDFLSAEVPGWKAFDACNLLENSPARPLLAAEAARRGWNFVEEPLQPAPCVLLPETWEAYLAGLKKKQRHEIRRKLRRAAAYESPVRWYAVSDEDTLDDEVEAFLHLMAYDPAKESFLSEVMRSQMRRMVHAAFRAGWLQLAFLEVGGEKAAAYLNLDFDNQLWVYNSGLNPAYRHLSPGWVLLAHIIRDAIARGRTALDFMRGDEAYKYRFGGQDRFVWRARLERGDSSG